MKPNAPWLGGALLILQVLPDQATDAWLDSRVRLISNPLYPLALPIRFESNGEQRVTRRRRFSENRGESVPQGIHVHQGVNLRQAGRYRRFCATASLSQVPFANWNPSVDGGAAAGRDEAGREQCRGAECQAMSSHN